MLVQLNTNKMVMDPCFHGSSIMIDFGGDEAYVGVKRNHEKGLTWHEKKVKTLLRRMKIKFKMGDSQYSRAILPPKFSGLQDVIFFFFELQDTITINYDSASGVPVEATVSERYCFNAQWPKSRVAALMDDKGDNPMVNWFLRLETYQSISKKEFTRVKRAILKQLSLKVGDDLKEDFYWVKRS